MDERYAFARAAHRGRDATEGGDERAGVRGRQYVASAVMAIRTEITEIERLTAVDGLTAHRAKRMAQLTALDGVLPIFRRRKKQVQSGTEGTFQSRLGCNAVSFLRRLLRCF
jgi:hypothetical protein